MKLKTTLLIVLFSVINIMAQEYFPKKEAFNGNYYSLKPIELRTGEIMKYVTCEVGEINTAKELGLGIISCEECYPGIYKFKEDSSKKIERAVFYNEWGAVVIQYDEDSFVRIVSLTGDGKARVDFFSKSKSKAKKITEEKVTAYAMEYMEKI